jgi:tRNA1(Val) A37 N6-methylase TrmN6
LARLNQLSLLSRGPLFDPQVKRQYLDDMRAAMLPGEASRAAALQEWVSALATAERGKETSLEQHFNQKVLVEALGYRLYPADNATAWPKTPTSATQISGEPDVALGAFQSNEEPRFGGVLELKTPGTNLDAPQARARALTPVQQAFEYGEQMLGVRWVLVSDMRRIRLYSIESPHEYIEFDLEDCVKSGVPQKAFRDLYWLVSEQALIRGGTESPVAHLYSRSVVHQLAIRDSFYEVYDEIRMDLLSAVIQASQDLCEQPERADLVAATQRLLDRMLFLYYCEDSPERLIPSNTVRDVTEAARKMLGPSTTKVYDQLKLLFREIDTGSPPGAAIAYSAYNGELFKHDAILDEIDLPDSLHDKVYILNAKGKGVQRKIQGVWGLHAFDFWRELNEHLLGHVFERSLSDLGEIAAGVTRGSDRLRKRRQHGIYYTSELLSDYLSEAALRALLREVAPLPDKIVSKKEMVDLLQARTDQLGQFRIIDLACGSGAFLVSSYQALLEEFWRVQDALDALSLGGPDLLSQSASLTQAQLLRKALHGVDLLPQAVEIAKLALWLRSARKGEKVADLSHNIVPADSLDVTASLAALRSSLGSFDLVLGNPPWGAEVDPDVFQSCCAALGLDPAQAWDSWELFVALGLACLREGGRLALVLPDTIFSPEKSRIRRLILESGAIEYFHNLGTGWFDGVRMGTTVLQVRRGPAPLTHDFPALLLAGDNRKNAIDGKVPLSQLEANFARFIPQDRSAESPDSEIEVFRSARDDEIMRAMDKSSQTLADLCEHGRGEEMAKSGLLWICQNCFAATVPAKKIKRDPDNPDGPRYDKKTCPGCGLSLDEKNVASDRLVKEGSGPAGEREALFIDGDDITTRYQIVSPKKLLRLDFKGFDFKGGDRYEKPKLLIRQAGVGLMATLDTTGARCPQSVYYYRLTHGAQSRGYANEFLLAVLLSRTIAFYVFKRFGEVDPARAHAKVTHERLSRIPVPDIDFDDPFQKGVHDEIVRSVTRLLGGEAEVGGQEDMRIDIALRELWGLSAENGLHINLELAQIPAGQVIRELFPQGAPKVVLKAADSGNNGSDVQVVGAS